MSKKTLNKLCATGLFDIFGSSIIVKIIGFMSSIILVRIVTKEAYGVFTVAWNIYSIAMLATGFGASYAILQLGCENSKDVQKKKDIFQYGWNYGFKANIIIGILVIILGLFFPFSIPAAAPLMRMMFLLPLIQFGVEYQSMYLRVEKKNRAYAIANIVNVGLVLLFSIVGACATQEKGFIIGRYVAYMILILLGIRLWNVPIHFRKTQIAENEKKDFRHVALVSMINGGISQLLYLIDVFILGIVLPNESIIASYKVATIIPTALSFIPTALVTYIFPYFTENRENGKWCLKRYLQVTEIMALVNGVISSILFIMAPFIIKLMYGTQYLDAIVPFRILAVNYFFSGTFRSIAGNLLVTQRKLGFNTFVAVVSGILNIFADVLFILKLGSDGAAYATLSIVILCSVMNVGYLLITFIRKSKS